MKPSEANAKITQRAKVTVTLELEVEGGGHSNAALIGRALTKLTGDAEPDIAHRYYFTDNVFINNATVVSLKSEPLKPRQWEPEAPEPEAEAE